MKQILMLLLLVNSVGYADPQGIYESKCQGCHGVDGMSYAMTKSEPIATLTQQELEKRLKAYKWNKRNAYGMGTLMQGQVANYNDMELKYLADYISELSNSRVDTITNKGLTLEIKTVKKIQKRDNYFLVEIKLTNNTWHDGSGGITLSFPQYQKFKGDMLSKSFSSVGIFQPPKKMYNRDSKTLIKNRYLSIEGWEKEWEKGITHFITLKLEIPKEEKIFKFQVRGNFIYKDKKKKNEILVPNNELQGLDQQGYPVKDIEILVK